MSSSSDPDVDRPEVLAVVPARAGSKGIPRKNMKVVGGMSLIARACIVARDCPSVSAVVVSSDDSEMLEEGERFGADLAIKRPDHLATDEATGPDTWMHAWEGAEEALGRQFDLSVWLQPTSPTRTPEDVESTISAMRSSDVPAAMTVSPVPKHFSPYKQVLLDDGGAVSPVIAGQEPNIRRQDVPNSYWLNGLCYTARREVLFGKQIVIPEGSVAVIIDREVTNIDSWDDLEFAKRLLSSEANLGRQV